MKIIHLSTLDTNGGAALATYRLHRGLQQAGHESSMFVATRSIQDPAVVAFVPPTDFISRFRRRLRRERISRDFNRYRKSRPAGCEIFNDDRTAYSIDLVRQLPFPDVINLHWIARFVDYRTFFSSVPARTPIAWRLSDMNPFTGGCHVDEGCGKFRSGCGRCPQLGSNDPNDLSSQIWRRKQDALNMVPPDRLHIVALNRWMAQEVKQAGVFNQFPITIIPNGVDIEVFAPRDRYFARNALGIPQHAKVVLFIADGINRGNKGLGLLIQALDGLSGIDKLFLISVGSGRAAVNVQTRYLHMGSIDNDRILALIYSAADLFVIPSLCDNLPNTVLESMACGTPVVGFEVGGIPDMIRPRFTGLLVPTADVKALRAAIADLLEDPVTREKMGVNCRRIAVEEYSRELQVRRYAELYKSLI